MGFVLLIIAAMTSMTLPVYKSLKQGEENTLTANRLRMHVSVFKSYASENEGWPPSMAATDDFPTGMSNLLDAYNWTEETPLGGHFVWEANGVHNGTTYPGVIVISDLHQETYTPITASNEQLTKLDFILDDGDLTTGRFQLGFRNVPIYILDSGTSDF
ncbi:MAG: hypothetical protein ACFBZ8_04470 [Opitutales bacterium]